MRNMKEQQNDVSLMQQVESSSSSFSLYMKELQNYNTLNLEEQKKIGLELKDEKTRQQAKQKLITSNLKLVVKIAHQYLGIGLGLQDLVQQGNMGLIRAVDTFDSDKGVKFSTYSANWIKNYISRAINKKGRMIRVPIATEQKRRKLKNYIQQNKSKGIDVSDDMIKQKFGLSDLELKNGLKKTDFVVSMNAKYDGTEDSEQYGEILADITTGSSLDDMIRKQDMDCLKYVLDKLDERQKTIINMRYGLLDGKVYTLKEVADKIGKTYQRVRQLENDAVVHLKTLMLRELNK